MKTRILEWHHIDLVVEGICREIRASRKSYMAVCGITRGGLIPAVMLSHRLDIPMVPIAPESTSLDVFEDRPVLVVDEIYDTGKTINWFLARYPVLDTAVLFSRPLLAPVTFKGYEVIGEEEWLVFPWERGEQDGT